MTKIMIVDDAAFMRESLKRILKSAGYDVAAEAKNGREAVHMYELVLPDLVMMDITMPEMDGLDAIRAIRALHPNANIIICSAMGQKLFMLEAIQAGAKDFVVKPFFGDQVLSAVKAALA